MAAGIRRGHCAGSGRSARSRTGASSAHWPGARREDRAGDAPWLPVYNPETLLALRAAAGPELGPNFDPSHLFWQGIDPVARHPPACRRRTPCFTFTPRTRISTARNIDVNGVIDTKGYDQVRDRAWTFRTVGFGHGEMTGAIVSALRVAGYDDVISIEHEDILLSRDEGLARAVQFLRGLVPSEPPDEPGGS